MSSEVRLDLHTHSAHSPDSRLALDEIASNLPKAGLRGFALTDHNSVAGHRSLEALRPRYPGFFFLPGVEVSTLEGHLLAYGVREVPPLHRPVAETIEWVRDHGGEPVLAHPFRFSHGVGRTVTETARVGAIEVRNGHNSEIANLKAEAVATRRGLGLTGGSDVHELADLGRAFTEFPQEATSTDDLLESIRTAHTVPGGYSLAFSGRVRLGLRAGFLLLRRGFRPI